MSYRAPLAVETNYKTVQWKGQFFVTYLPVVSSAPIARFRKEVLHLKTILCHGYQTWTKT
jgi:hypothetical protein